MLRQSGGASGWRVCYQQGLPRPQLFQYCSFARWNVPIWPCSTEIAWYQDICNNNNKKEKKGWHKVTLASLEMKNPYLSYSWQIFALQCNTLDVTHCHKILSNNVLMVCYSVYCPTLVSPSVLAPYRLALCNGWNTRSYEHSVQISPFPSFWIQNCDWKTKTHCSCSTFYQAAETAVRLV